MIPTGCAMNEQEFINEAIKRGLVRFDQVQEALNVQAGWASKGASMKIWEIFLSQGVAEKGHIDAILTGQPAPKTVAFGPFEIKSKLGEGGMGSVFLATKPPSKENLALKVLPERFSEDTIAVERFEREAKVGISLSHPNLVKGYEYGQFGNRYFFSMEYVKGRTVSGLVKEKARLEEKPAIQIAIQVAGALEVIHKNDLVHRDVKPDNMIIAEDGTVKLMDLGLVKSTLGDNPALTDPGKIVGTLVYSSPEQIRGEPADIRSDIYSLGLSLYRMLTGVKPASATTAAKRLQSLRTQRSFDPRAERPELSAGISRVVLRMTAWRPPDRYQTPSELLEDLHLVLADKAPIAGSTHRSVVQRSTQASPPARLTQRSAPSVSPSSRKSLSWVVGIAAVLAIIGIYALTRPTPVIRQAQDPLTPGSQNPVARNPEPNAAKVEGEIRRQISEGKFAEANRSLASQHGTLGLARAKALEVLLTVWLEKAWNEAELAEQDSIAQGNLDLARRTIEAFRKQVDGIPDYAARAELELTAIDLGGRAGKER